MTVKELDKLSGRTIRTAYLDGDSGFIQIIFTDGSQLQIGGKVSVTVGHLTKKATVAAVVQPRLFKNTGGEESL